MFYDFTEHACFGPMWCLKTRLISYQLISFVCHVMYFLKPVKLRLQRKRKRFSLVNTSNIRTDRNCVLQNASDVKKQTFIFSRRCIIDTLIYVLYLFCREIRYVITVI